MEGLASILFEEGGSVTSSVDFLSDWAYEECLEVRNGRRRSFSRSPGLFVVHVFEDLFLSFCCRRDRGRYTGGHGTAC